MSLTAQKAERSPSVIDYLSKPILERLCDARYFPSTRRECYHDIHQEAAGGGRGDPFMSTNGAMVSPQWPRRRGEGRRSESNLAHLRQIIGLSPEGSQPAQPKALRPAQRAPFAAP